MNERTAPAATLWRPNVRDAARPWGISRYAGYLAALLIGILFVASVFPGDILRGASLPDYRYTDDIVVHVVGQRAFLRDTWHWPLLWTTLLDWPRGLSIAMTDSIPLLSLALKPFAAWIPTAFPALYLWLALNCLLQPVAAVFALRSLGERRIVPAVAAALLAAALPTFLYRFGHVALSSHFTLLLGIGSYARTVRGRPGRRWLPPVLLPLTLLIHPYLAFMMAAVLAAAPLSLLVRGDRRWREAALVFLAAMALTVAVAATFGYAADPPDAGYGFWSMNLLSPVWRAAPPGWFVVPETIDATGGQYEGFQYLGAGILLLLIVAAATARRWHAGRILRAHAGLIAAGAGLTALALSNVVYLGHIEVLNLGPVPAIFHHLRGSGRLFWPVAYVLLLGSVVAVSRSVAPRFAWPLLLLAASLQVAETGGMRLEDTKRLSRQDPHTIDVARLDAALAGRKRLVLTPTFDCGLKLEMPGVREVLLASSRFPVTVNTMFTARTTGLAPCPGFEPVATPLQPDELRIFMGGSATTGPLSVPDATRLCRVIGPMGICAANPEVLSGLPPVTPPSAPIGQRMGIDVASKFLGGGWFGPEPFGVWSAGPEATLALRPAGPHPVLHAWLHAYSAGEGPIVVTVVVNGRFATQWVVGDDTIAQSVPLGDGTGPGHDGYDVKLRMSRTDRPSEHGLGPDQRDLAIYLHELELTTG